jgi:hypothetical protein
VGKPGRGAVEEAIAARRGAATCYRSVPAILGGAELCGAFWREDRTLSQCGMCRQRVIGADNRTARAILSAGAQPGVF